MNKSLPTVSSTPGSPKKKHFSKVKAILACTLLFLGLSMPAAFAGVAAWAADIVSNAADTSSGGFVLQDNTGLGVTFFEQRSNAAGSFTTTATLQVAANPSHLPTTDRSKGYTGLLEGQTIRVVLASPVAGFQVPTYTRPVVTPPPPVSVTPAPVGWDGATVTIPVPIGHYVYKDGVTGAVLSAGPHPVAVGATLSVIAQATNADTVLTVTDMGSFTHVPPVVLDGDGDGVPDSADQCPSTPASQVHLVNGVGCVIGLAPIVTLTGTHNATATADGSADFTVKNPNEVGITYQVNVSVGGGFSLSVGAGATATMTVNRPSGDYSLTLRAAGSTTNPVDFTIGSDVVSSPTPAQAPVLPTFVDTTSTSPAKLTIPAQGSNTPDAWTYTVDGTLVSASGSTLTVTGTVKVVISLKPGFSYNGCVAPYSITKTYAATVVEAPVQKPVDTPVNKPADTPVTVPVVPVQAAAPAVQQQAEQTAANNWHPDLAARGDKPSAAISSNGAAVWAGVIAVVVLLGVGVISAPRRRRTQ